MFLTVLNGFWNTFNFKIINRFSLVLCISNDDEKWVQRLCSHVKVLSIPALEYVQKPHSVHWSALFLHLPAHSNWMSWKMNEKNVKIFNYWTTPPFKIGCPEVGRDRVANCMTKMLCRSVLVNCQARLFSVSIFYCLNQEYIIPLTLQVS